MELGRDGKASNRSEEFHKACDAAKVGESTRFSASAETKEILRDTSQEESIAIRRVIDNEYSRAYYFSVFPKERILAKDFGK